MEIKFSKIVKELREQHRLTQNDFATAIGTTQRKVSYWETSKIEPDLQSLWRIADYFDVTVDYLLGRVEI
ncbi:MAG: helix-turn-helix domain-containing protein [Clostridiales bacterium]|nr:helix-turn-helix domain-containing protein [Clostridiales bacterium]